MIGAGQDAQLGSAATRRMPSTSSAAESRGVAVGERPADTPGSGSGSGSGQGQGQGQGCVAAGVGLRAAGGRRMPIFGSAESSSGGGGGVARQDGAALGKGEPARVDQRRAVREHRTHAERLREARKIERRAAARRVAADGQARRIEAAGERAVGSGSAECAQLLQDRRDALARGAALVCLEA